MLAIFGTSMTHTTSAIILRTVKYGETSLVVTAFTELFGVQTYMVNGVRSSKPGAKANLFQPGALLEMVVYHHAQKSMQRIREFRWHYLYEHILSNVIKNSVALYMVELLHKCLKQPEPNPELFGFCEDALLQLDKAGKTVTANFPLFFSLHLAHFFGFKPQPALGDGDTFSETEAVFFDLREGYFDRQQPAHPNFLEGLYAQTTAQLLKVLHPQELEAFQLNHDLRRKLLVAYQDFYTLHISDFGQLKTMLVMQAVLS